MIWVWQPLPAVQPADLPVNADLNVTEGNDTLSATATLEIQASLAATEANDVPTAAGALTLTASAFIVEADDTATADATLLITASAMMTEADDVPSALGALDLIGLLFAIEQDDTLAADAPLSILAQTIIAEEGDTLDASALMPIWYARRSGIDPREEFERRRREWQEDLRRIVERSWQIANGEIDPVTFEPIPPPDYSAVINTLLDQALSLDRRRAEDFIAEQRRLQEDEAVAILLLAA
jgi:hypothetical protein